MYKSCSKCGKIHDIKYKCNVGRLYNGGEERALRNSHQWHSKAVEIKERSNYLCEVCKQEGKYTYDNLEVHHIVKVRDDKDKLLDDYNLICLCTYHHKLADNNEIDPNILRLLAEERERKFNNIE